MQMKQLRPLGLESRAQMGRNVGFWGLNVRLGARRWAFVTGLEFVRCRAAFWGWDVGEWSVFGVFFGVFFRVVTQEAFYCGSGVNFGGFRHLGGDGGRPFVGSNLGLK